MNTRTASNKVESLFKLAYLVHNCTESYCSIGYAGHVDMITYRMHPDKSTPRNSITNHPILIDVQLEQLENLENTLLQTYKEFNIEVSYRHVRISNLVGKLASLSYRIRHKLNINTRIDYFEEYCLTVNDIDENVERTFKSLDNVILLNTPMSLIHLKDTVVFYQSFLDRLRDRRRK